MGPSYNNSFGNSQMPGGVGAGGMPAGANGVPMQSAPISSGQGDIILAPSTPRSGSKRWLVVVVVVFFLVAVVTGIAALVVGKGGDMSTEVKDFNRFANYALYGKVSDNLIDFSKIDVDEIEYAVTTNLEYESVDGKGDSMKYYSKLYELKNNFMIAYAAEAQVDNEEAELVVRNIDELVDFMKDYITTEDPSKEQLTKLYGKDDAYIDEYVKSFYKVFNSGNNEYAWQYGRIKTEALRITAVALSKYDLFGACLSDDVEMQECESVTQSVPEDTIAELIKSSEYNKNAADMVKEYAGQLAYYVARMAVMLGSER